MIGCRFKSWPTNSTYMCGRYAPRRMTGGSPRRSARDRSSGSSPRPPLERPPHNSWRSGIAGPMDVAAPSGGRVPRDRAGELRGHAGWPDGTGSCLAISDQLKLERMAPSEKRGSVAKRSASAPFVHAKAFAFRTGNDVVAFVGSANCSRAALTCEGALENAELMAVQSLTEAQFESEVLGELEVVPGPPKLLTPGENEPMEPLPSVRIAAARLDQGVLRVGFVAPDDSIDRGRCRGRHREPTGP